MELVNVWTRMDILMSKALQAVDLIIMNFAIFIGFPCIFGISFRLCNRYPMRLPNP